MYKNVIRLFTFMLTISLIFTACNKDTSLTGVKDIDPTEQKILDFKEKMKSPNKSGETMSIEEAVWNIEAALNYTYCYVPEEVPEVNYFIIDSAFSVNTEIVNEQISFNDVISAYNQIKDYTLTSFEEFNGMNKFLNAIDVKFENNTFKTKIITEFSLPENKSSENGWIWGFKWGNCNGQYFGQKDATTEIYRYVRNTYPQLAMSPGYWTNIEDWHFDSQNCGVLWDNQGPWYSSEQSPFGDNIIIYDEIENNDNYDRCLVIGESYDWYKYRAWDAIQGAKEYIDDYYIGTSTPRKMKSYFFTSVEWTDGYQDIHSHRVEFEYGVYHIGAPIH